MEMESLECRICTISMFVGGRLPKVLRCGHSVCSFCVYYLVSERSLSCPMCKTVFDAPHQSEEVPYNFMAIKILRSMPTRLLYKCYDRIGEDVNGLRSRRGVIRKMIESLHAGYCDDHGLPSERYCIRCRKWLCEDCTVLLHDHATCHISTIYYCSEMLCLNKGKGASGGTIFHSNVTIYAVKKAYTKMVLKTLRTHLLELKVLLCECHKAIEKLEEERTYITSVLSDARAITDLLSKTRDEFTTDWGIDAFSSMCSSAIEMKKILNKWFCGPVESKSILYSKELEAAVAVTLSIFRGFLEDFKYGSFTFDLTDPSNHSLVNHYLPLVSSLVRFEEDCDETFDMNSRFGDETEDDDVEQEVLSLGEEDQHGLAVPEECSSLDKGLDFDSLVP